MKRMANAIERAIHGPSSADKERGARWAAAWGLLCGINTNARLRSSEVQAPPHANNRRSSDQEASTAAASPAPSAPIVLAPAGAILSSPGEPGPDGNELIMLTEQISPAPQTDLASAVMAEAGVDGDAAAASAMRPPATGQQAGNADIQKGAPAADAGLDLPPVSQHGQVRTEPAPGAASGIADAGSTSHVCSSEPVDDQADAAFLASAATAASAAFLASVAASAEPAAADASSKPAVATPPAQAENRQDAADHTSYSGAAPERGETADGLLMPSLPAIAAAAERDAAASPDTSASTSAG